MVNHIVYFKFNKDASSIDIKENTDAFRNLSNVIEGIVSYSAGKTFAVDYEDTADFDVMHCLTFESKQALQNYFFHDAHQAFIQKCKDVVEAAHVVNATV